MKKLILFVLFPLIVQAQVTASRVSGDTVFIKVRGLSTEIPLVIGKKNMDSLFLNSARFKDNIIADSTLILKDGMKLGLNGTKFYPLDSSEVKGLIGDSLDARLVGMVLNVRYYGLSSDGSIDNTTALNNLIISSDDSSIFYFPAGTYKISSTVNITKTIYFIGDGKDRTILNLDVTGQINIKDNFSLDGFTLMGNTSQTAVATRCTTWVKNVIDFIEISNNKFYGLAQPFSAQGLYDTNYHIIDWRFNNNIIDSCSGGFEASTKYTNLYITNNSFMNMYDRAATFSCLYVGAALSTLYDGETIISNNIIDSVNCTNSNYGNYGMLVYADNAIITDNIIRNFSAPNTGTFNYSDALYLAGSNIVVDGNLFYNASETHQLNTGQVIFCKGEGDLNKDRIISNNIFYSDRDSGGYAINMRSPANIYNNHFVYTGNYVYINGVIRPAVSSGVTPEYDVRPITIRANTVEANTNFLDVFGGNLTDFIVIDNYLSIGDNALFNTGVTPVIGYCKIFNNRVLGKLGVFSVSEFNQLDIIGNSVLSQSDIINIDLPTNINIIGNTFTIDTSGALANAVIDIYIAVPDKLTVTNIKNNTVRIMNAFSGAKKIIYFTGGEYFIEDNTFIVDSVASGTMTYLYGIWLQDSTEYCKINNNKFITFGSEGLLRGIFVYDGVHNRIDVTNNYFDDNITKGVYVNNGTVSNLDISENDWNGTTLYQKDIGTITRMSRRQNWGDGIYELSEYADADSLYKVIYDFTNSVQDTIGILR